MELILNKKRMCLPNMSSIFKKLVLNFWPHCVVQLNKKEPINI
jgi:hypothetical protein